MLRDGIQFRRRQKNQSVIFGRYTSQNSKYVCKKRQRALPFFRKSPMRKFYGIPFRNDRIRSRSARSPRWRVFELSCSLGFVSIVGDFSTAASTSLEMTRLSTVSLRRRADEGVPPYRNGKRHSKRVLARGVIPAGGRGTPLPILPKVSTGIADLPAGAVDLPTAHRHCRLAILAHQRTRNAISF